MPNFSQKILASLILTTFLFGCSSSPQPELAEPFTLDETIDSSENFYEFVNANWLADNPIPDDKSLWSTIHKLRGEAQEDVIAILENAAPDSPNENEKLIGQFFAVGMDEEKINSAGAQPALTGLERIAALQDLNEISHEIGYQQRVAGNPFFTFWIDSDLTDSDTNLLSVWQNGLSLPDVSYYLDEEEAETREKYLAHVAKIFELAGDDSETVAAKANKILAIETEIAQASRAPEELRDVEANYNKMTFDELQALTPNFDWTAYFEAFEIAPPAEIDASQPEFFEAMNEILGKNSLEDLKTYLAWKWLDKTSNYLSADFENENFDFYDKNFSGALKIEPREKRVVNLMNSLLGEAIGQIYVEKYFSPEAKTRAEELVQNLLAATAVHIDELDWMSDETKEAARAKLAKMNYKIGYPEKWRDYSMLKIGDNYLENVTAAIGHASDFEMAKIGQSIDREEWGMSPQTVNAYYDGTKNEIVFPAAILQPPLFDANADDAVNYGGIGMIIGHEITHAFDDQGSKIDANGELNEWWTESDRAEFENRAAELVEQFDEYTIQTGEHVNGTLTLGENIADLGGIGLAYTAFQMTDPDESNLIDGYTPSQRFFLNFARNWRANTRDETADNLVKVDVHSPMQIRVIGPLANFTPFYETFEVSEGSEIWRDEDKRVKIW